MNPLIFPLVTFLFVVGVLAIAYAVWAQFFNIQAKAKKQRLNAIQQASYNDAKRGLEQYGRLTERFAFGLWLTRTVTYRYLERLAHRAHSTHTPQWWMIVTLTSGAMGLVVALMLGLPTVLIILLSVVATASPTMVLSIRANQRRKAFEDKLPEALDYISRALRAGHSLTSAIGMVGKEFADPIGFEFKTVFDQIGFGISFKEAIDSLADRIESNDLNFFVISLMIQHETGGNLTELLDGLAKTMRERVKLRGKIRTLSSEGRASAMILGGLPFVLLGILSLLNPEYTSILWTTEEGLNLLMVGASMLGAGFFFLNRIAQIRV